MRVSEEVKACSYLLPEDTAPVSAPVQKVRQMVTGQATSSSLTPNNQHTCHEIQKRKALKILGFLVAELHNLMVALP